MRRGRQNVELKLFGCKNVPYVGQINVRWWGKNIWGYKKLQGRQKASRGAKKLQGAQEAYKKNRKNSGDLFCLFFFFVGAPKISAGGCRMVNMVNVTPLPQSHVMFKNAQKRPHEEILPGSQDPLLGPEIYIEISVFIFMIIC